MLKSHHLPIGISYKKVQRSQGLIMKCFLPVDTMSDKWPTVYTSGRFSSLSDEKENEREVKKQT